MWVWIIGFIIIVFSIFVNLGRCNSCGKFFLFDLRNEVPCNEPQCKKIGYKFDSTTNKVYETHKFGLVSHYDCTCGTRNVSSHSFFKSSEPVLKPDTGVPAKFCSNCSGRGYLQFTTSPTNGYTYNSESGAQSVYIDGSSGSITCGKCNGYGWRYIKNK